MADTLPIAELVHAMQGRTRLRIAARRGDAVFFASVATGLSTIPGVHKVEVRPLTGSLVIEHSPPLARIAKVAEEARLFELARVENPPPATPAMPFEPKIMVAVGLGVFALSQLARGHILPPAITLAWYAANLVGLLSDDVAEDAE
jgi:Heavy metal associated domain 2